MISSLEQIISTRRKKNKLCRRFSDIFHYLDDLLTKQILQIKLLSIRNSTDIGVSTRRKYRNIYHLWWTSESLNLTNFYCRCQSGLYLKWHIVVDYRKINEKTIDDKYPILNITNILSKLGRYQYFSTLDLASWFHQIEMAKGHFEHVRMSFGLKNASATFQWVIYNILKGL